MVRRQTKDKTVVIIGMGDTGVLVATRLSRHFNVIGISTKPNLVSGQELGKRLADLSWWNRYYNTPLRGFKALADVEMAAQPSSHQYAGVAHANNDNGLIFCLTSDHLAISADLMFFVSGLDYLTLNGVRSVV